MEFILASSNSHKADELNELLTSVEVIPASEKVNVIEDGKTFTENAFKKAEQYSKFFKGMTVADDSGLVVEALPDELGVRSARFAPEFEDYKDKNRVLLEKLAHLKSAEQRRAYFVCILCFYKSEAEVFFFEGRVKGHIALEAAGDAGFGYDPVFIPEGQQETLAQIPEWKMANSHRSRACKEANQFFNP